MAALTTSIAHTDCAQLSIGARFGPATTSNKPRLPLDYSLASTCVLTTLGPLPLLAAHPGSVVVSWPSRSMLHAHKSCHCARRTRTTSKLFSILRLALRLAFARYATSSKYFATWAIFDIHAFLDSKNCKKRPRRGPYRPANWTPSKWRVIPGHSCRLSCRTCSPYISSLSDANVLVKTPQNLPARVPTSPRPSRRQPLHATRHPCPVHHARVTPSVSTRRSTRMAS